MRWFVFAALFFSLSLFLGGMTVEIPENFVLRLETHMHSAPVMATSLDGANRTLLTVSRDKTARVWSTSDGRLLHVLRVPVAGGTVGELWAGALSGDGSRAFVGGDTPVAGGFGVHVFDVSTGSQLGVIGPFPAKVVSLALSPDGNWLGVGLENGSLGLYNAWNGNAAHLFDIGESPVKAIAFSPDGNRVGVVCSGAGVTLLERSSSGFTHKATTLLHSDEDPTSLCFGPENTLWVVYADGPWVDLYTQDPLGWKGMARVPLGATGSFSSVLSRNGGFPVVATGDFLHPFSGNVALVWENSAQAEPQRVPLRDSPGQSAFPLGGGKVLLVDQAPSWWVNQPGISQAVAGAGPSIPAFTEETAFGVSPDGLQVYWQTPSGKWNGFDMALFLSHQQMERTNMDPLLVPNLFDFSLSITGWKGRSSAHIGFSTVSLGEGEEGTCFCLDPGESRVFLGTNRALHAFSGTGGTLWTSPVLAPVVSLVHGEAFDQVVALLQNGMVQWFRASDGQLLVSLFVSPDAREWMAWTPIGFFTATPGAETFAGWHANLPGNQAAFYALSRYFQPYFQPLGVLQSLQKNEVVSVVELPPPPVEQIVSLPTLLLQQPDLPFTPSRDQFSASVLVQGNEGRVTLDVCWNGRLLRRVPDVDPGVVPLTLPLQEGENRFRVVAVAENGLESEPLEWSVLFRPEQPLERPTLWGIFVGVAEYAYAGKNLSYSGEDATRMVEVFRQGSGGIFQQAKLQLLVDARATLPQIQQAFDTVLQGARPGDTFVFFFSGHGGARKKPEPGYFLALHDAFSSEGDLLAAKAFSAKELGNWATKLPGVRFFAAIDACQSGTLLDLPFLARMGREQGMSILTATSDNEAAYESASLQSGSLSFTLLHGLKGEADTGDGRVDSLEAAAFSVKMLDTLMRQGKIFTQVPRSLDYGEKILLTQGK